MAPGGQGALINVCNGKATLSVPRGPGPGVWEGSRVGPAGHRTLTVLGWRCQRSSHQKGKLGPREGKDKPRAGS